MENSKSYISYAEANRLSKLFEKNKEKNIDEYHLKKEN